MVLVIGEILFDIFPEYRRLGGAPFNFAYHLKNLGMDTRFISRVGRDEPGQKIIDFIDKHGFNGDDIQVDPDHETGTVHVKLNPDGTPEFNIRPNAAYDYIQCDESVKKLLEHPPALIYFGTLMQRTGNGFQTIQQMLSQKKTATRTLYDINLRPGCYSEKIIAASLERTDILKLNHEELSFLSWMLREKTGTRNLIDRLFREFAIESIVLTAGENGSEWFTDKKHRRIKPTGPIDIVDTVGAGDAYAAIVALGYLQKWPVEKILSLANCFAAHICSIKGALPDGKDVYNRILKKRGDLDES
ncbi:MAG: carbohydrate kinase [Desulfobacterales bacterium]|nr:carbohydrate kinase [Desulfobacterales bacterium]